MKKQEKFRDPRVRRWVFLLSCAILFVGIALIISSDEPRSYPKYESSSPSPTGLKGFDLYLKRHFQSVGVWRKKAQQMPDLQVKQLMIMVGPYQSLNHTQASKWKKWMRRGNDLLLVDRHPQSFDIRTHSVAKWVPNPKDSITGEQDLKGTYIGSVSSSWRIHLKSGDHVLLKDSQGVLAISRQYGKGHLMVLLTPNWFANDHILDHDHLNMILPLINRASAKRVWINENIHGAQGMPSMLSVYPKWFLFLFGDLLLLTLLWLWYKGKQFGPVELPREGAVRFGDERLHAAAAWYRRGKFYHEAIAAQTDYLRHLIQEKWGISTQIELKDMLLASQRRLSNEQIQFWQSNLQEIDEILDHRKAMNQKDFLKWTRVLDEMRKEVGAT